MSGTDHIAEGVADLLDDLGHDLPWDDIKAIVEAVIVDLEMSSPPVSSGPASKQGQATVRAGDAHEMWRVLTGRIQDMRHHAGLAYLSRHEIYPEPKVTP